MKLSKQRLKEIIKEEMGRLEEVYYTEEEGGVEPFHPDKALEQLRTTAQSVGNLGEAASIRFSGYDTDHPLYRIAPELFEVARTLEGLTKKLEEALDHEGSRMAGSGRPWFGR